MLTTVEQEVWSWFTTMVRARLYHVCNFVARGFADEVASLLPFDHRSSKTLC